MISAYCTDVLDLSKTGRTSGNAKEIRLTLSQDKKWIVIKMPYHKGFVKEVKDVFISQERKWDPEIKCWMIIAEDPNQDPEIKTPYEWVKDYLNEIAKEEGWELLDFVA